MRVLRDALDVAGQLHAAEAQGHVVGSGQGVPLVLPLLPRFGALDVALEGFEHDLQLAGARAVVVADRAGQCLNAHVRGPLSALDDVHQRPQPQEEILGPFGPHHLAHRLHHHRDIAAERFAVEELVAALEGAPVPCVGVVGAAHREPRAGGSGHGGRCRCHAAEFQEVASGDPLVLPAGLTDVVSVFPGSRVAGVRHAVFRVVDDIQCVVLICHVVPPGQNEVGISAFEVLLLFREQFEKFGVHPPEMVGDGFGVYLRLIAALFGKVP